MRAAGHDKRRRSDWRSPGSRARSVRACQGLRPRRVARALAMARPCVLPSADRTASAPGSNFLRGSMAGLHVPLSTLRHAPRDAQRMTRGQHGSLHLCCEGLTPFAPCRSPGAPDPNLSHPWSEALRPSRERITCSMRIRATSWRRSTNAPGDDGHAHRQPRRAASIAAMSIFFIDIIASNARLAAAGSGSEIASRSARGVICQDTPHLSLHQPKHRPLGFDSQHHVQAQRRTAQIDPEGTFAATLAKGRDEPVC